MGKNSCSRDRLGILLGRLRVYEGISQAKLAQGLCTDAYLTRVEKGEREADKLLIDTLFQRLGKSADLFKRFLDAKEIQPYHTRKLMVEEIEQGRWEEAEQLLVNYQNYWENNHDNKNALNDQFIKIMELNLDFFRMGKIEEQDEKVLQALYLTQPDYGKKPLSKLLLSRNEAQLILTHLELQEKLKGRAEMGKSWREIFEYFSQMRYEKRERIYLLPFVACHVAEWEYENGNLTEAKAICDQIIGELQEEKKLFNYKKLLVLQQKIIKASGRSDEELAHLIKYLDQLQKEYRTKKKELWIPYSEGDNVHNLNQAIANRRNFLLISQENLAYGVCDTSTVSRIEQERSSVHKRIRRGLLQKVNLSGERYDYEIITEDYTDYLRRSQLGRLMNRKQWEQAGLLLEELRKGVCDTPTNRQYIEMADSCIREQLPEKNPGKISLENRIVCLWNALKITLPTLPENPEQWSDCTYILLSVNEIQIMKQLAHCYDRKGEKEKGLYIMSYIKNCLGQIEFVQEVDVEIYTLCMQMLTSILGDCGRYEESDEYSRECLKLLFGKQQSTRITGFLYNIAWNREQQLLQSGEMYGKKKEECLNLFRQIYAATLLFADDIGRQHILRHCENVYGINIKI